MAPPRLPLSPASNTDFKHEDRVNQEAIILRSLTTQRPPTGAVRAGARFVPLGAA
jgi:hypothetical protein